MGVLDKLVGVTVSRHNDHVVALRRRFGGQRGQDVIGFVTRSFDDGDTHGVHQLAHQAHLLAQYVGRSRTSRLVTGHQFVAESRLRPVKGNSQAVRLVVLDQVHEHGGKAVDGIGHLSRGRGQVRGQGEKGPVSERVAVEEHQ